MSASPQGQPRRPWAPAATRWGRRLGWTVAAVLALWAVLWLALPPVLRWAIERQASERLGRAVTLEAVQVTPWSMEVSLRGLRISGAPGAAGAAPSLEVGRIVVNAELESVLRLAPVVNELRIESPHLRLTHLGGGRYDVDDLLARLQGPPSGKNAEPARFSVFNIAVTGGELDFTDGPRQRTHTVRDLQLGLPFLSNIGARREVFTQAHLALTLNGEAFRLDGKSRPFAADRSSEITLDVPRVALQAYAAYWPAGLPVQLQSGELSLRATLGFEQHEAPKVTVSGTLGLRELRLARDGKPLLALGEAHVDWQAEGLQRVRSKAVRLVDAVLGSPQVPLGGWHLLALEGIDVDLAARRASAQRLLLEQPRAVLQRRANGRWAAQDVMTGSTATNTAPAPSASPLRPPNATAQPPWQVTLAQLQLVGGMAAFEDLATPEPVRLDMAELNLEAGPLAPLAATQAAIPLRASLRLSPGGGRPRRGDASLLSYEGSVTLPSAQSGSPLQAQGQVQARHLPLHTIEPYLRDTLNLDLLRADLSYAGRVEAALPPAGPNLRLAGQLAIDDLRARTLSPGEELLDWKALNLRGLQVQVQAGALRKLSVDETVLNDFFARVIISREGRLNLQDLVRQPPQQPRPQPVQVAAPSPPPDIRFGPIALVNGRVHYSDRFVQPNYSANLSGVTGKLGAFSNRATAAGGPALADLSLRGRAEGTASLEIQGKLNPLAQPLALDLQGRVRDLELPPLSPYSGKYAGYGIERGKLSLDVAYRITPDGQLTASNQVVLNQLSFGDHVEGSQANLPVKLAVALLADRQGIIDINLPISGSINDPQFSLGPVIVKVIFNLIGKAITAPFALLASAFGDGPDHSAVAFAPGRAELDAGSRERLQKVAQALVDRPALRLTVVGHSDPAAEDAAWRRARLDEMVRAEKRRQASRGGMAAAELAQVAVAPGEYPGLLKEVYRRADITKPRNLVGIARELPQDQMEALLMASVTVTPEAMRELALARSVAVRDFMAAQAVPTERLFLGAPVAQAGDAGAAPRATLTLGVK